MRVLSPLGLIKHQFVDCVLSEMVCVKCQCEMIFERVSSALYDPFLNSRVVEVLCMAGPWCSFFWFMTMSGSEYFKLTASEI